MIIDCWRTGMWVRFCHPWNGHEWQPFEKSGSATVRDFHWGRIPGFRQSATKSRQREWKHGSLFSDVCKSGQHLDRRWNQFPDSNNRLHHDEVDETSSWFQVKKINSILLHTYAFIFRIVVHFRSTHLGCLIKNAPQCGKRMCKWDVATWLKTPIPYH